MAHKRLVAQTDPASYPVFLRDLARKKSPGSQADKPVIVTMAGKRSSAELQKLIKENQIVDIIDNYAEQYAELILSRNAHLYRANYSVQVASIKDMLKEHYGDNEPWQMGCWIYFPWSGKLSHVLEQTEFEDLRTIRNRDLITSDEQKRLLEFEVGCFGMSVGSASAQALAISGLSRRIKLTDGAVISGSNLNRIMTGVESVGLPKNLVIARQIYEMNPFAEVVLFDKITKANAASIFDKPFPIRLAVDEIDDLEMKLQIRAEARNRKVPVVMATELGDSVMLDVERFDLEPSRPLFHGYIPGIEELLDRKVENHREWMKYAVKIIDPKNMPLRMQESLLKIGSTIVTHPQLGSTVMMTGGVVAFAAKNIALGTRLDSGRYLFSLENMMLAEHRSRSHKRRHKKHTKVMNKAIDSM